MPAVETQNVNGSSPSKKQKGEVPSATVSMEARVLAAINKHGIPAKSICIASDHLKGGYICDTFRVTIEYADGDAAPTSERPASAIVKRSCETGGDHAVALALKLYEREWHFYESGLSAEMPLRVPRYFGSLLSDDGESTVGVLLEDLCLPGAVLAPELDEAGVLLTARHVAKLHAKYWNDPKLASGALGIRRHDDAWFKPSWLDAVAGYWPKFEAKWRVPDGRRPEELPEEAFAVGEQIVRHYGWVQTAVSSAPHTFVHGDVKPGNMFMMADKTPAFIDWQYTAVGKGCAAPPASRRPRPPRTSRAALAPPPLLPTSSPPLLPLSALLTLSALLGASLRSCADLCFMIIEGYDVATCTALEPKVKAEYLKALKAEGVSDYTAADLDRDWQLATLHFPFYVAMWFGTTPDEQVVDPDFPRRFVPRAFAAILRNGSHKLLPA